jgi:tetratricopeptide (TPR) repeat protein
MSLAGGVAQVVTIGLLFVFWRLGQKWVVVPAVAAMIFLFFFLPRVIARLEQRFHKKALMMLATGKAAEVPSYASRQVLLSLFGASAPVDAKLGLALTQLGRFEEAIECLSNAIPFAPRTELPALQAAYVKSLLVTGDVAAAETVGMQMLKHGVTRLPEVLVMVARAKLAQGKTGPETGALLEEAATMDSGGDTAMMCQLTQIELQLAHRRKPVELSGEADSTQPFVNVWIHLVRGLLREQRGKIPEALSSYGKAIRKGKEDRCIFAELARNRFESLSKKHNLVKTQSVEPNISSPSDANALDDVSRRKRRKRR